MQSYSLVVFAFSQILHWLLNIAVCSSLNCSRLIGLLKGQMKRYFIRWIIYLPSDWIAIGSVWCVAITSFFFLPEKSVFIIHEASSWKFLVWRIKLFMFNIWGITNHIHFSFLFFRKKLNAFLFMLENIQVNDNYSKMK